MAPNGWVKPYRSKRLPDQASLGVLVKVFPATLADEVIAKAGAGEQRSHLLPASMMVYCVMALALHAAATYEEVMPSLLGGLQWISQGFSE